EHSFPEVADDARAQLHGRGTAIRSLADELDTLLEEQLAALAEEETRVARIAAELEDRARLLTERERGLIDQRERLPLAESEPAAGRRRLGGLGIDGGAVRTGEPAVAGGERKEAVGERGAVVGELGQLHEGLSAAIQRAAEVE